MHPLALEKLRYTTAMADRKTENILRGYRHLKALDLIDVLELATAIVFTHTSDFNLIGPADWPYRNFVPSGTVHVKVNIPYDQKHAAIKMFGPNTPNFVKKHSVTSYVPVPKQYIVESWTWQESPDCFSANTDQVSLCFYRPTTAGERINETCVVIEEVTQSQAVRLALVCKTS